jgi:hypothetical protein
MTLVRAIITFINPSSKQLIMLSNAIVNSPADHNLFVASPSTQLVIYSDTVPRSLKVLSALSANPITQELIYSIRNDVDLTKLN